MVAPVFKATRRRPDGEKVLEVGTPYMFTWEKAARALATVYQREPLREGQNRLVDGLHLAVRTKALTKRGTVPDTAVDAYKRVLRDKDLFPEPAKRERMLAELRRAQEQWRSLDPATRPSRAYVPGQPRTWAKDVIEEDDVDGVYVTRADIGEPALRIEEPSWYLLDEAALALAVAHTRNPPGTVKGQLVPRDPMTMRTQLKVAGAKNMLADKKLREEVDPDLVAAYRKVLTEKGIF